MDGEIILNRSSTHVMKLDDNEQALMNEIEIDIPRPQPVKKQMPRPMKTQFTPPQTQTFQEGMITAVVVGWEVFTQKKKNHHQGTKQ